MGIIDLGKWMKEKIGERDKDVGNKQYGFIYNSIKKKKNKLMCEAAEVEMCSKRGTNRIIILGDKRGRNNGI